MVWVWGQSQNRTHTLTIAEVFTTAAVAAVGEEAGEEDGDEVDDGDANDNNVSAAWGVSPL